MQDYYECNKCKINVIFQYENLKKNCYQYWPKQDIDINYLTMT